jgi:uncharacterized membrane protein
MQHLDQQQEQETRASMPVVHHGYQPQEKPDAVARRARQFVGFFAQHWLGLMLTSLVILTVVPFLAPVAMEMGWTRVGNTIYSFYSYFCHQLPQRSWFFFGPKLTYTLVEIQQYDPGTSAWNLRSFVGNADLGWKVAWSDRMISFYFMTPIFGLVYAFLRTAGIRVRPMPWQLLAIMLVPMAIDGVTHGINDIVSGMAGTGFRDTNAWLAILTGGAFPALYAGDQWGSFNAWARLITGVWAAFGLAFFTFPWLDQLIEQELRPSVT